MSGAVAGTQIGLTVTGALAVNSALNGGAVALTASGAITEATTGLITATTLSGSAQSLALPNANQIATLGSFATTAGLSVVDSRALTVTGPVTDGRSIALSAAGPLTLSGTSHGAGG